MRIIAGKLGGRQLQAPTGHKVHPMSDKMRGALFNSLGDIAGLSVLDAFAGSGALCFEAVSRGAKYASAIEVDKNAHQVISKNIQQLGLADKVKAIRANAASWSENNQDASFDLVLLDPPYDAIKPNLLEKLAAHAGPQGVIVLSLPPNSDFTLPTTNYVLLTTNSYGDSQLVFYRNIG